MLRTGQLGRVQVGDDGRIAAEDFPDVASFLVVGRCDLAGSLGVGPEGMAPAEIWIKTFPNAVVMMGADGLTPGDAGGSRYAVTTFLEDALGVRFLWPGELGKVVPGGATVEVGEIDHRFAPLMVQRRIRMAGAYGERMAQGGDRLGITAQEYERVRAAALATESRDGGWSRWHRLGGSLGLASGHSFGDYWERFGESHPEWFAMGPDGSRDQGRSPGRARLCVSNPDLVAQVARDRIARIDETGQRSISIGPNDGGQTAFCTCPECEALDAPTDRRLEGGHVPLTDRYIHFFNGIAEKVTEVHPDVWLTADAYSTYAAPRSPPASTPTSPSATSASPTPTRCGGGGTWRTGTPGRTRRARSTSAPTSSSQAAARAPRSSTSTSWPKTSAASPQTG